MHLRPFWKILFALIWLVAAARMDAKELRVAVFSPDGDRETEDLCIVTVSTLPDVRVVERRELNKLLDEQTLRRALGSLQTRAYAGQLSGAEVVLSVRKTEQGILAEVVDAATGVIIGRSGPSEASVLAGQVRSLLAAAPVESKGARVAVADFAGDGFRSAVELRENLRAEGFTLLDRAVIEHAVAETALGQAGLVSAGAPPHLLGADFLVRGERRGDVLALSVLGMAGGSLVAAREFAPDEKGQTQVAWLKSVLPPPPPRRVTLEPFVQVEALVPLYEGVASFRDGDLRGALLSFWRAQELDDKFLEALEWEARCYDALNLSKLAAAVRRYARECLVGRGISVPTRNIPADGIMFLGIQPAAAPAVEMKAVNALLAAAPGRVVLPENLSAFRDEYDALIGGVGATPGWTRAPGFLTRWSLRGTPAPGGVRWTLFDTLSGRIVASDESETFSFGKLLADAAAQPALERAEQPVFRGLDATSTREKRKLSAEQSGNLALLQRLTAGPADAGLWGLGFKRGYTDRDGLAGFLNFALREELIAALPADNLHRAWLELIQIGKFLPWEPTGRLFSGKAIDPVKALQAFIDRHPDDAPGAVARYILLWEVLDNVPRDRLVRLCETTAAALKSAQARTPAQFLADLETATTHLNTLAKLALHGPWLTLQEMPREPNPRRVRPQLKPGGQVELDYTTGWVCNEWNHVASPRECWRQEAVAALHILGRRNNLFRVPDAWMEESPDSIALLDFAVEALHEVDHAYGAPFLHPLDMDAQRANYLRIVDYCERGLPRWMARVQNEEEFSFLTGYTATRFIKHLTRYGFMDAVPDARFLKIQENTTADVRKAAARLGFSSERGLDYWSRMPRRQSVDTWAVWTSSAGTPCDYDELMAREADAAKSSWAESPAIQKAWWRFMRQWDSVGALRPQKQAEIALRHYGEMQRVFPEKDAGLFGYEETAFIFDYAYTLFAGRSFTEAESWFRLLADAPESVLLRTQSAREIRESARLYRAYCLVAMDRPDEALSLAKRCAALPGGDASLRLLEHIGPKQSGADLPNRGSLHGTALRLVRDLRLAANMIDLPANVRGFQIPIPRGAGARITFFLRIPPGVAAADAASRPLLVLAPSLNHGAEDYMQDTNAWARFADENGFFILVPEFNWTAAEINNAYQVAADWSGETLLSAVEWVGRSFPQASTQRLLVHGYGGGGQFVQRFARWAPERCLAVSSHSTGAPSWMDGMPGQKPFGALRGVPMLVTCGTDDDLSANFYDRLAFSEQYVTAARGAGVPIIWKRLKDVGHLPNAEMEDFARLFLATYARPTAPAASVWVGDLRNGRIWRAGDAGAASIPARFRQDLPTGELARAWSRGLDASIP